MNKTLLAIVLSAVFSVGGYFGYQHYQEKQLQNTYQSAEYKYQQHHYDEAINILKPLVAKGMSNAKQLLDEISKLTADYKSAEDLYELGKSEEAVGRLKPLAEQGMPQAQFLLGEIFDKYFYKQEWNYKDAVFWYQKAARENYIPALLALHKIYYEGRKRSDSTFDEITIIHSDIEKSISYLDQASQLGDSKAKLMLAKLYIEDDKIKPNYAKALELLNEIKDKESEAYTELGYMYEKGLGVSSNLDLAFEFYRKGTELDKTGNSEYLFGLFYYNETNYDGAKLFFEDSSKKGNLNAKNMLATMYHLGKGVEKNQSLAEKYFDYKADGRYTPGELLFYWGLINTNTTKFYTKAAEKGVDAAQNNLANIIYDNALNYSSKYKKEEKFKEAFEWYLKAAEQGNMYSQNSVGEMYRDGEGIKQNYDEALKWLRLSVAQNFAPAMTNLGVMYENGQGVNKDYAEAIKWYQKAVDLENIQAMGNLAFIYQYGKGVKQDSAKALELWKKAAENGSSRAMYKLGNFYEFGELGIKQNDKLAFQWYLKSAEANYADGQFATALMYANGKGTAENKLKAIEWYVEAARKNNAGAFNNLGVLHEKGYSINIPYSINGENYTGRKDFFKKACELGDDVGCKNYDNVKNSFY